MAYQQLTPDQVERNERWVKALLSGEYEQGKGMLRDIDGGFCCLGVACDLFQKDTGEGRWDHYCPERLPLDFYLDGEAYDVLPPVAVAMYYGWSHVGTGHLGDNLSVRKKDGQGFEFVSELNDTGSTFQEIAQDILGFIEAARPVEVDPTDAGN